MLVVGRCFEYLIRAWLVFLIVGFYFVSITFLGNETWRGG